MTRDQKIAKARELREEGLSYREIEAELGVPRVTLNEWLNPKVRENHKLRQMSGICSCGNPMSAIGAVRCEGCRGEAVDKRARQIEAWWAEGLAMREIAKRLGWTMGHFQREMDRLREKGYSLPYRYKTGKRNATKFPELAA